MAGNLVYSTKRSRLILNDVNGICWESRRGYADPDAAMRFANMVRHNHRFADAQVVRAGNHWTVRLYPSSLTSLYSKMMARTNAAVAQDAEHLSFRPIAPGLWVCRNEVSGGEYRVSSDRCNCRDWVSRKSKLGAPCKHIETARRIGLFASGALQEEPKCSNCGGTGEDYDGWAEDGRCPMCKGTGIKPKFGRA